MINKLEISEDIYHFIDNIPLEKENVSELIEYVHYKALLDLFTYVIENNDGGNLDYLLSDYVEVISKIQVIINNIKLKYDKIDKLQVALYNIDKKDQESTIEHMILRMSRNDIGKNVKNEQNMSVPLPFSQKTRQFYTLCFPARKCIRRLPQFNISQSYTL